jgi:hypothetical protein
VIFDKKLKWFTVKVEVKEDCPMYVHAASEEGAIDACKMEYGRIILNTLRYRVIRAEEDDE